MVSEGAAGTAGSTRGSDWEAARAALGKYTQTDDQAVLDETYRYYRELWGRPDFRVAPEAVASILRVMDVPGADTAVPTDFVDNHFIDELTQAGWLQRYPEVRVTIEGHCDERGTREYNLALGDRRANAAKNYLQSRGIDPSRMTVISWGKERPTALGSDETAWAQNRRAVTVVPD